MRCLYKILIASLMAYSAQLGAKSHEEDIKYLLKDRIERQGQGVGASVAVLEKGEISYINIGFANLKKKTPMTQDHIQEIGSITKTFTAMILANMAEAKEVKLSDAVEKYLPGHLKMPSYKGRKITLEDLATHRSGLPRVPDNIEPKDMQNPYADYTVEGLYEFLSGYQLTRKPGTKVEYSNLGYGLLGHVLSLKAGMSYEELVDKKIFKPLGLALSFAGPTKSGQSMLAMPYGFDKKVSQFWNLPVLSGAGSIKSNAVELMKYISENMTKQSSIAIQNTQTPRTELEASDTQMGLAWLISEHENGRYYWHDGGTGGFRSFVGFDKQAKRAIVMLANSPHAIDEIGHAYFRGQLSKLIALTKKSDLKIKAEKLVKLNGVYNLVPGFDLTVSNVEDQLYIQATGQSKFPVYPKSATKFFYKVVKAEVKFETDSDGLATSITLFQNGQVLKGKKL